MRRLTIVTHQHGLDMAAVRNIDEGQSDDNSDENGAKHLEERTDGLDDKDLENKTEELDAKIDLKKRTENLLKAEKNKLKGGRIKRRARNRKRRSGKNKQRVRNRKRSSRKNNRRAARKTEDLQKPKRPEKTDLEEMFKNLDITDQ